MTRRTRLLITGGVLMLIVLSVVGYRGCGSRKSAAQQTPAADQLVTTTPALQRVETAITTAIASLTSRVETLEKVKPSPMPTANLAVKAFDRKFEKLNGEVGGFGRRILDLEEKANRPPTVPPTAEPEFEEELTDEELARQYRQAVRRGKLPD